MPGEHKQVNNFILKCVFIDNIVQYYIWVDSAIVN